MFHSSQFINVDDISIVRLVQKLCDQLPSTKAIHDIFLSYTKYIYTIVYRPISRNVIGHKVGHKS